MKPQSANKRRGRAIVQVEDRIWRKAPDTIIRLRRAAARVLEKLNASEASRGALTVLLTSDERLHALNAEFRRKNKPSNVLSFPSQSADYLGDIAIAYGVASREAKSDGKSLADHVAHLTVHGVLHLLGYDHQKAREADIMESIEIEVLAEMGIPNPYARRKRVA